MKRMGNIRQGSGLRWISDFIIAEIGVKEPPETEALLRIRMA
jgi:hypothetical protein